MRVFFLLIIFPLCLFSNKPMLSSKNVELKEKTLILDENVSFSHLLGHIKANHAVLEEVKKNQNLLFESATLEGDVTINAMSHAHLLCDKAYLDNLNHSIELFSISHQHIYFTCPVDDKPLFIKSYFAKGYFSKNLPLHKNTLDNFYRIDFDKNVRIKYADFSLTSDKAKYISDKQTKCIEVYGETPCVFKREQDCIFSSFSQINLLTDTLFLKEAHGQITMPIFQEAFSLHDFSCQSMTYDKNHFTLYLKKNVCIESEMLGSIHADEIVIQRKEDNQIKHIMTKGQSRFYFQEKTDNPCLLTCSEDVFIDNDNHLITANRFGAKIGQKPLFFSDNRISLFANTASIHYQENNKNFTLSDMTVEGDIYFFFSDQIKLPGYGTADKIYYNPFSQELILYGEKEKVMFCKEDSSMKMRANKISVVMDKKTKQDEIKAEGVVHFSFTLEEESYIKEMFNKYLKQKPSK